jgi:outer membrane protein TolC
MYWNLVNAYEQARVSEQSLAFAQRSLENARKQLQLQAVPAMDVLRAEAEVSRCDQDLTVARTNLELQESLMKNALTRNLDDPALEAMPVIPADQISSSEFSAPAPLAELLTAALQNRPELSESDIDLQNRQISRQAARNALLPSLSLTATYSGSGLAGELNPIYQGNNFSDAPTTMGGALLDSFNNSYPDYYVGLTLQIPIRNRVAKADQYRSELEYRQAELRREQLKKQIRIEVRNARYALEQSRARVESARKARDLAARTFSITEKELELGAGSHLQVLTAQRDLALAEQSLAEAVTTCEKAQIELTRATGSTLDKNHISIADAISGTIGNSRLQP